MSSFLDSRNSSGSNGSYMTNVTVDPVSDTRHDVATVDGSHACVQDTTDSDEENTYKSGESTWFPIYISDILCKLCLRCSYHVSDYVPHIIISTYCLVVLSY